MIKLNVRRWRNFNKGELAYFRKMFSEKAPVRAWSANDKMWQLLLAEVKERMRLNAEKEQ